MLEGKSVVVTGAGRGLGRAYAVAAAEAGASVLVTDVTADADTVAEEIRASGGRAAAVRCSVSDADEASAAVARCIETFGSIDGLVNNAGVYHESALGDEEPGAARRLVDVNVLGAVTMGTAAARAMRTRGGGVIVNITSGAAMGYPLVSAYCASKGAILSLTYAWALDGLACRIRVNAVAPIAATAMTSQTPHQRSSAASAGQPGDPTTVAPLVVHLLSDAADFTGQAFRFDGRTLQVIAPPRPAASVTRTDPWTVTDVAAELGREGLPLEKVGAAGIDPWLP